MARKKADRPDDQNTTVQQVGQEAVNTQLPDHLRPHRVEIDFPREGRPIPFTGALTCLGFKRSRLSHTLKAYLISWSGDRTRDDQVRQLIKEKNELPPQFDWGFVFKNLEPGKFGSRPVTLVVEMLDMNGVKIDEDARRVRWSRDWTRRKRGAYGVGTKFPSTDPNSPSEVDRTFTAYGTADPADVIMSAAAVDPSTSQSLSGVMIMPPPDWVFQFDIPDWPSGKTYQVIVQMTDSSGYTTSETSYFKLK